MQIFKKIFFIIVIVVLFFLFVIGGVEVVLKKEFKVVWLIYVGWMLWGYVVDYGIVKKWVDKYGIKIDVMQFNDYVEFMNQYMVGVFDVVMLINMDGFFILVVGGVDMIVVIVGDFFNGNDVIILKNKDKFVDIKGQNVNFVEFLVFEYFLVCVFESVGMIEKDVKVVNMFDVDMVVVYKMKDVMVVVIWNLLVFMIMQELDVKKVFDSFKIFGEIIDFMVVNLVMLKDNLDFGKVLVGIWYDMMKLMMVDSDDGKVVCIVMGEVLGMDFKGFEFQMVVIKFFDKLVDVLVFVKLFDLLKMMDYVCIFFFLKGLFGNGVFLVDVIGIEMLDGLVLGDKGNVKLCFVMIYMDVVVKGVF